SLCAGGSGRSFKPPVAFAYFFLPVMNLIFPYLKMQVCQINDSRAALGFRHRRAVLRPNHAGPITKRHGWDNTDLTGSGISMSRQPKGAKKSNVQVLDRIFRQCSHSAVLAGDGTTAPSLGNTEAEDRSSGVRGDWTAFRKP